MESNLNSVIKSFFEHKKHYVKKSSLSAYILLTENHLKPYFGHHINITEDLVQTFVLDKIEAGLSHKTIKDILIVLKMILKFGAKKDMIVYKPWDIDWPTNHRKEHVEVLTAADHKKAMNYVKEHMTFRNLGILICLSTGMRIGEVCALKWSDIDLTEQIIHVNRTIQRIYVVDGGVRKTELILDTPKTRNSIRQIPLTKDLMTILKAFNKIVNPEYFLLTNDEKPTEPRTYRSYYKNFMEKIGVPVIKFHGLRHSFATRCIENKADYKTVSVLLGHSNISTTLNLYVHPNAEQKRNVINSVFKKM